MKILYHHRTASRDGQSTHIDEMIRALRANGHEVRECGPPLSQRHLAQGMGSGRTGWVSRFKLLLPRWLYELGELAYSVLAYRRLARAVRDFAPDMLYERYNLYLLAGLWTSRRFRLPLLLEVNAPMAQERRAYGGLAWPGLAQRVELYIWKNATVVLPVTHVLARQMVAQGVQPERITVIPNAIDPAHYQHLPGADQARAAQGLSGRLVIGFTGFVREWDRLERVVKWLAARPRSPMGSAGPAGPVLHLLVVGDGPARASIEQCARAHGVASQVSFTGVVARQQVPALAMAFDVALQTALVPYASPLCLFEYLALGKAIVAPNQPNHLEIVRHGVNAWLYDAQADDGLEQALNVLCADAALREQLARAARQVIAAQQLTWRAHAEVVAALGMRLLQSEPEPTPTPMSKREALSVPATAPMPAKDR
jgi:glycosyltransferase involved in cell wall biosynthesis